MSRSTTHRYVITLVALGYLEQGASRKYRLGLRVTDLGMSALDSTGLREHAHPELEELRRRTSYTAGLGVLDGEEVLYIDRARGFRREQQRGRARPAARLASAGALHRDRQAAARLPARARAARADRQADADQARPEHDHREEGAARRARADPPRGPRRQRPGARARAAHARRARARRDRGGARCRQPLDPQRIGHRLAELVDSLGPQLVATADRISASLGYRGDDDE